MNEQNLLKQNQEGEGMLSSRFTHQGFSAPRERRPDFSPAFQRREQGGQIPASRQRRLNSGVADATREFDSAFRGLKPTAKIKRRSRGEEAGQQNPQRTF